MSKYLRVVGELAKIAPKSKMGQQHAAAVVYKGRVVSVAINTPSRGLRKNLLPKSPCGEQCLKGESGVEQMLQCTRRDQRLQKFQERIQRQVCTKRRNHNRY